jgi:uroporphyrinogen-III synthase
MSNVLLLRTPTSPDAYITHLHERGFTAFSLAVLETTLVHISHLSDIQRAPPTCDGVILTSARAAEAWHAAARHLLDDADTELKAWTALPFYVVGSATARALRHSNNSNSDDHTDEEDEALIPSDIRGAESGTGEALARFILSDLGKREARLLLLVGDKNTDTIPNILHEGGVQVETLQVYETHGAHGFGESLSRVIRTAGNELNNIFCDQDH